MLTYRPADPALDLEFAREVHHAVYRDVVVRQFGSWDEELQNKFFQEGWARAPHYVVMLDGVAIGVVSYADKDDLLYIYEVQILPRYQRQGLGTAFLMERIDEARRHKKTIKLKVLRENEAKNLYERMGFALYGQDDTHVEMEWRASTG